MGFVLWCYYMFMLCAFISLFLGSFFLSCFIASLSKSILPFTSFTFAVSSIFCLVFCFVLVFLMQRYHVDVKRENMIFFFNLPLSLCALFSLTDSFILAGLDPFLNYTLAVAAITIGIGVYSSPVYATTLPSLPSASPTISMVRKKTAQDVSPACKRFRISPLDLEGVSPFYTDRP